MGKRMLTKEDIILLFLEDSNKLILLLISEEVFPEFKSEEIKELMYSLGNIEIAYYYNIKYDRKLHPLAIKTVCSFGAHSAYWYAMEKGHHEDLRQKVSEGYSPGLAYKYARYVEKKPHPITRKGVKYGYDKASSSNWEKRYTAFEKQYLMNQMRKKKE